MEVNVLPNPLRVRVSKISWWGTEPNAFVKSSAISMHSVFWRLAMYKSSFRVAMWSLGPPFSLIKPLCGFANNVFLLFSFWTNFAMCDDQILYIVDVSPIGRQF